MPLQLLEGMASRKRRPNWTYKECLLLAQLMLERKEIIRGKCSTGVSIQDKRQAWEEIAQTINTAFPQMERTVSDCNKKWENMLAKSREEIKQQKRQADAEESPHLEQFSAITQIVISVMNLSNILQQDSEDSQNGEWVETKHNSFDKGHTVAERFTDKPEHYADASTASIEQKPFSYIPKTLALQSSDHHAAAAFPSSEKHLDSPCSTPESLGHCTSLQEKMDLEMSVLRRQEAVLKLQEEYYTLKIKMMKKKVEYSPLKD